MGTRAGHENGGFEVSLYFLWGLFILFAALQIVDMVTTVIFLREGKAVEGNPLAKKFIEIFGIIPGLLVIKIPVTMLIGALSYVFQVNPLATVMNGAVCGLMVYVIIHNARYIKWVLIR
jgi:hypothetical protein